LGLCGVVWGVLGGSTLPGGAGQPSELLGFSMMEHASSVRARFAGCVDSVSCCASNRELFRAAIEAEEEEI
jgi:hypothetical protein